MKIVSHALRVAIAGGIVAGAAAVAAPSSSDAAVTTVGSCTNTRQTASVKSSFLWPADGKAAGITDKSHDATVSTKGVHAVGGVPLTIGGSCTFTQPVAGGLLNTTLPAGTFSLTKVGAKTTSPNTDCVSDVDPNEWPLSGKLSFAYSDLTKTDAYVVTANPTGSPADLVSLVGIVTKGRAVGAQLTSQVGYTPVLKDTSIVTDWDGTEMISEILGINTSAADRAVIQGYAIDPAALGCQAVVEPTPNALTNLRTLVLNGGGVSPILGSPISGTTFTIGAP